MTGEYIDWGGRGGWFTAYENRGGRGVCDRPGFGDASAHWETAKLVTLSAFADVTSTQSTDCFSDCEALPPALM